MCSHLISCAVEQHKKANEMCKTAKNACMNCVYYTWVPYSILVCIEHVQHSSRRMKEKHLFFSDIHRIEPDCHHPSREPHRCHFGACPSCQQVCGKLIEPCKHECPAPCHSAVWVTVEEDRKPVGPWDKTQPRVELQALPCPSCKVSWKTSTDNLYAI